MAEEATDDVPVTIEAGGERIETTLGGMKRAADAIKSAGLARDQLKSFVERIERLEEEKQAIADDIKEVYAEAKSNGFDTKTLRQVVRERRMDAAERQEREALLDLYRHALGMLADTPLGQAAMDRAA